MTQPLATPSMSRRLIRIFFAGPGAIIISVVIMAGMTLWVPHGRAGIDNLVVPLILLPLIWVVLVFHACIDRKLARVAIVALGLLIVHGGLVAHKFMTARQAAAEEHR